jgi:hypothetical protein
MCPVCCVAADKVFGMLATPAQTKAMENARRFVRGKK